MIISKEKYPHPVYINFLNSSLLENYIKEHFNQTGDIFIICDSNTSKYCYSLVKSKLKNDFNIKKIEFSQGEINKNLQTCEMIWDSLLENHAKKDSLVINLGGGVVTDIGGFCASLYMRGLPFINIPTSLMAMADASIGGKTGVGLKKIKNCIGNIVFPAAVFVDAKFLDTLAKRERASGYYEMIKHGLIADEKFFHDLTNNCYDNNIIEAIQKSIDIKMDIISKDPYELGLRKSLNFGHTIGHAIESAFLKYSEKSLLHGEAILVGMIAECFLSVKKNLLSATEMEKIVSQLALNFPRVKLEANIIDDILAYLLYDKKHSSKQLNFTLITSVGNTVINQNIETNYIKSSLSYLSGFLSNN